MKKKRKQDLIDVGVLGAALYAIYYLVEKHAGGTPMTPVTTAATRQQLRPRITSGSLTTGRAVPTQQNLPYALINKP